MKDDSRSSKLKSVSGKGRTHTFTFTDREHSIVTFEAMRLYDMVCGTNTNGPVFTMGVRSAIEQMGRAFGTICPWCGRTANTTGRASLHTIPVKEDGTLSLHPDLFGECCKGTGERPIPWNTIRFECVAPGCRFRYQAQEWCPDHSTVTQRGMKRVPLPSAEGTQGDTERKDESR